MSRSRLLRCNYSRTQAPRLGRQGGAVQPLKLAKIVIMALLAIWLVSSLVQLFWLLMPEPKLTVPNEPVVKTQSQANTLPKVDIASLQNVELFGKTPVAPPVEEVAVAENVEETQLNLVLKGLFATEDIKTGRAIIAEGKAHKLYSVDDSIEGLSNVKLVGVYNDKIILNNRGKQEALYLYPEGERIVSAPGPSPELVQPAKAKKVSVAPPAARAKRLNQIMRVVRERDKTSGDMIGFRVLPGRDRTAFEQSGLKVNDIITAIDGEQLNDLRAAMNVYRSKREATQVSLSIKRDDSDITVDIDLNALNI